MIERVVVDAETRFHARAQRSNPQRGLALLDKLETAMKQRAKARKVRQSKV